MKKNITYKILDTKEQKEIFAGKSSISAGSNKCCWDNYPNICSECTEGTKCQTGSHLVTC